MPLQLASATDRQRPRWSSTSGSAARHDPVDPVTDNSNSGTWSCSVVGGASGLVPDARSISDLFSISQQVFSSMLASAYCRLRSTRLISGSPVVRPTLAEVMPSAPVANVIEAAKARWKSRAQMESKFIGHLLAGSPDVEGLPSPRTRDDDDV
jgi:hypothetical protein